MSDSSSANFPATAPSLAAPFSNAGDMQQQFEGIIRSATEAIITIDESQTILIFNPMAEKLFACAAQDAIGTSLDRFIPQRYRDAHARQVREFGVTGISQRQMGKRLPLFGLRADGTEFPIEASISQFVAQAASDRSDPVSRGIGGRRLYTVLLRDITARLQAEAELQASRNELRLLSGSIQTAREHEQSRIARELHDDLGQRLTALKVDLSLLEAELDEQATHGVEAAPGAADTVSVPTSSTDGTPARWRKRTRAMQHLIDDTVQAVRRIAADLRPVMLDDLGLVAAIDWLASEWRGRHGIVVTVCPGTPSGDAHDACADAWPITDDAATAFFRIVQEALTNIARHANATRAIVTLEQTDASPTPGAARQPCYRIWVADNGVGLAAAKAAKEATAAHPSESHRSFGLIGMRERATLIGGVLDYGSPDEVAAVLAAGERDAAVSDVSSTGAHGMSQTTGTSAVFDAGFVICVTVPCAAVARRTAG
ncbi:PAS domain-containing sensor histidine kinase [Robbsia sp. KACC 23696]|uniref:PAS domain-containing sensor histidine kinase n=1 Tax=Robbsia sp. KACC 23696 TaxID=3149231 RepID=UPI00325A5F2A